MATTTATETKATSSATPSSEKIYGLVGTTGKIGGHALKYLSERKHNVRAILRDDSKSASVLAAGAKSVSIGDMHDPVSLSRSLSGVEGALLVFFPKSMDPSDDWVDEAKAAQGVADGILGASPRPKRIVLISSIMCHTPLPTVLKALHLVEQALRTRVAPHIPCVIIRPGGFFENVVWDLPQINSESGRVGSWTTVDRKFEQVSSIDIGRVVAEQLLLPELDNVHDGVKTIELEGPQKYSPADQAAVLTKILGRTITYYDIPAEEWEPRHRAMGMTRNPQARMNMWVSFNKGVGFEGGPKVVHMRGVITLEDAYREILGKIAAKK